MRLRIAAEKKEDEAAKQLWMVFSPLLLAATEYTQQTMYKYKCKYSKRQRQQWQRAVGEKEAQKSLFCSLFSLRYLAE